MKKTAPKPKESLALLRFEVIRTIQNDFELTLRLDGGPVHSGTELNAAFSRWIAATCHLRVHSSTGQTPHERFSRAGHPIRPIEEPDKIDPVTLVLVLDDAQNFPGPALEELRLLLGLGGRQRSTFALVLLGDDYLTKLAQELREIGPACCWNALCRILVAPCSEGTMRHRAEERRRPPG